MIARSESCGCLCVRVQVASGEEQRTTLRVANIPNKYTQQKLLSIFERNHAGRFDFFYLPIDFRNGGNLGYCFINLLDPAYIVPFCHEFDKRKWDMINSEKVCSIAFARFARGDHEPARTRSLAVSPCPDALLLSDGLL